MTSDITAAEFYKDFPERMIKHLSFLSKDKGNYDLIELKK